MIFKIREIFTQTFVITDKVYEGFLEIFKDYNPLHMDEQFAASLGFKGKVMHGSILSGFLSYFIGECLPDKNVIIHSQEIQFKNAVYLNDELLFEAKITAIHESVNTVQFKFTFKNKDADVVSKGRIQIGLLP